ncbi:unnamed protein product [Brachionus calyciflorus]|uniref:Protein kinase domain-containing protein n=1 Tax=Brachionus calyciflorus TaxID=104777 RepID=A0A813M208_9BILA|nr:unnamed protein product [Brachionus calyciflorus]
MNTNQTRTIDINNMLQRLSVLNKIPQISKINPGDDDDDDESEDDSADYEPDEEEEEDMDTGYKTSISKEVIYEADETVDEEEVNTLIIKKDNKIINQYENYNHIYSQDYKISTQVADNDYFLAPISIKTDFTCSFDNKKSPRSQLYDVALELEDAKGEINKLKEELEKSSNTKKNDDEMIEKLRRENRGLQDELNFSKRLIKELKETSQLNSGRFSEIDKLRSENQDLNDQIKSIQALNSQLNQQVKSLQRYEQHFKNYKFIEINKELYQIVNKIGQGGFSEVYHCISHKEHKSYAMKKVNLADLDQENLKLITNEIDLLKKLQNTGKVIQLYDYELVKKNNQLNVLMEMGSTDLNVYFKREIQKNQCVREPARAFFWFKMLEACLAIHKQGVIHSDIKPGNFLVVGCEVKLIDFNISNSISDRTSITLNNDCGTLNYMAPETLMRDNDSKTKISKKVDVWALGVILYFMTYGRVPFQHLKNQYKVMHAICDPLQKDLNYGPIDDQDLKDAIMKSLAHDPSKRYSVEQLLDHPYLKKKFGPLIKVNDGI